MPTTIKLKNSVTTTSVPSSLVQGEVAINITDKKVWVGNAATTPIQLLGGGADGNFTNISVSSVATFGAGTVSAPSITTSGDTNTGIYFPAADTIAFTEGGVESMRIDSSGNVGIGTSSPSNPLTVRTAGTSTSAGGNIAVRIESNGSGRAATLQFSDNVANSSYISMVSSATAFGQAGTEAMRIDSAGNVGIGTASPNALLTIAGASTDTRIRLVGRSADGTSAIRYYSSDNATQYGFLSFGNAYSEFNYNGSGYIGFATNNTERMRIDSSGNLLVGTTTAGLKLTVQDGVTIVSGDQSGCRLVLQNTTSPGRTFSLVAGTVGVGNDDFTIYDNTASATRVTLKANGEFIIGTTDNGAYNLQCNGTGVWGAGAYVNGSDERIKDNIEPLDSGLDVVTKLNPVTYKYKEDWSKDQNTQTGFIAQELLTALSGQIYVDGVVQQGGEYMSVAYQNIIPILTKAIQELNAKVAELEAKLK
jgi:hypothetical protein